MPLISDGLLQTDVSRCWRCRSRCDRLRCARPAAIRALRVVLLSASDAGSDWVDLFQISRSSFMIFVLIVLALQWIFLGAISFVFGATYGLDRLKVRRALSRPIDRNYLSDKGIWFVFDFLGSFVWFLLGFPKIGFAIGLVALVLLFNK